MTMRRSGGGTGTADPVRRVTMTTPIGPIVVEGDETGVTHILLPNEVAATGAPEDDGRGPLPGPVADAVRQLEEYFAGDRRTFSLQLTPAGTAFQLSVWKALADIPYGETVTYGELARRVGRPTAFRAVGQANGANPLPIVYPCHRVVSSIGLGGYGGGLDVKRRLLALEGAAG